VQVLVITATLIWKSILQFYIFLKDRSNMENRWIGNRAFIRILSHQGRSKIKRLSVVMLKLWKKVKI